MAGYVPDWTLQRKGSADQARHQQKIKEALKQQLPDLITEDSIVTADGDRIIRVPIRNLEEYRFRFNPWQADRAAQDQGELKPGDVLGQIPGSTPNGPGQGSGKPGEVPGIDYIEANVSLEDISDLLFAELGLPYLKPKVQSVLPRPAFQFRDISKRGLMGNLDKRRSLKENLLRHARQGQPGLGQWNPDDLRFKTWVDTTVEDNNAVVIAMRDISGSMGDFKKQTARTFAFWMLRFLQTKYHAVEVVFIVHHTQAREVSQDDFFQLGESGGTKVSSAYELCWEVIQERYPPHQWNIYPMHFSDGDNWSDQDNRRTVEYLETMLPLVNVFGYAEIREGGYTSTLMSAFSKLHHPRFQTVTIGAKPEIYGALKKFFPRTGEEG